MSYLPVMPVAGTIKQDLSFLWLEITAKCNLECTHCYADSGPRRDLFGRMSVEDWFAVLRDSAAHGCNQVQFIGGEPTLHPELPRMISFASTQGYSLIEVFTNLTLLNESLLQVFIEHGVRVATSFYTDDPATHNSITKHPGSFTRTVEGIKKCVVAGLPIRAGIVEMAENAGHVLRARQFLESIGVSEIRIDSQRGVGRGEKYVGPSDPLSELCGECWKGKLCVTPYGRVYPCVFSRFKDLGAAGEGISNILMKDALLEFRTTLKERQRDAAGYEMSICNPFLCDPTGSACGPGSYCSPETRGGPCSPDATKCAPYYQPCSPETECAPNTRPCGPERTRRDQA